MTEINLSPEKNKKRSKSNFTTTKKSFESEIGEEKSNLMDNILGTYNINQIKEDPNE